MITTQLQITGMHCASCKALIEDVCKDFAGVASCDVDFATGKAVITHDEHTDIEGLIKEIEQLDVECKNMNASTSPQIK